MKNIILIGFMGAGKTKVGKLLAKTLGYGFVDMDELIEEREGLPIKEIFEKRGEKYFREKEKEWLKRLSLLEKIVLSPGGGIILSPENRKRLRKMGKVFYLKASPKAILERVKNESHRPLLEGGGKEKKVTKGSRVYREGC